MAVALAFLHTLKFYSLPGSYAQYRRIVPALFPRRGRALDEATRLRLEAQALTEIG